MAQLAVANYTDNTVTLDRLNNSLTAPVADSATLTKIGAGPDDVTFDASGIFTCWIMPATRLNLAVAAGTSMPTTHTVNGPLSTGPAAMVHTQSQLATPMETAYPTLWSPIASTTTLDDDFWNATVKGDGSLCAERPSLRNCPGRVYLGGIL